MAEYNFPALTEYLGSSPGAAPNQDPERLAEQGRQYLSAIPSAPPAPPRNFLTAGIAAGVDELQGMGGAALGALGRATGIEGLTQYGEAMSERNAREAAAAGRPDLEVAPWKEGGASLLPWAGYQLAKQIPMTAGALLAGAASSAALPVAATGAAGTALARFGMMVPRFLGGGRGVAAATEKALLAGATEAGAALAGQKAAAIAGQQAAREAGLEFSKRAIGATAFGAPLGAGSMYQEAMERGEPTQGDAIKALALSPVYGALEAFEVAPLANMFVKGAAGNVVRRAATGAAQQALTEPFTEAAQTGLENSFRPDLTMAQKAERIVDAAATALVVGAGFGGIAGAVSPSVKADPVKSTTDDLKTQVDDSLNPASSLQQKYANLDTPAVIDRLARTEQRVMGGENTPAVEREFRLYRAEVSRRLSEMDDATVAQARDQVAQRIQAGDQSPTLQNAFRVYDGEIGKRLYQQEEAARRLAEQQPVEEQRPREVISPAGGLFSEEALAQQSTPMGGEIPSAVQAQQPAAKAQATAQIQKRVSDLIGAKQLNENVASWVNTTAPANDAELVNAVIDRFEARTASGKPAFKSNQQFTNLVEKLANPIAMQKELNAAQQLVIDTEIAVNSNKAKPQALEAAQQQVNDIQSRMATYQAVVQERASRPSPAPAAPQGAPSVEVSPPASQTGLPPTTTMAQTGFDFNAPTRETIPAANLKVGDVVVRGRKEMPITKIEPTQTGNLAITMGTGKSQATMRVPDSQTITRAVTGIRAAPAVEPKLSPVVGRERITQATPREAVPASTVAVGDRIIQGQRAVPVTAVSTDATGRVTITTQQTKNKKNTARLASDATVTRVTTQEALDQRAAEQAQAPQVAPVEPVAAPAQPAETQAANEPVAETQETQEAKTFVERANNLLDNVQAAAPRINISPKNKLLNAFKAALGWMSENHIVQAYDMPNLFNGALAAFDRARSMPRQIKQLFGRIHEGTIADIERLRNSNKAAYDKLINLMNMPGIKVGATWDEQPWLHGEKNAAQLKDMIEEANTTLAWLRQNWVDPKQKTKKVYDIYQDAVDGNEMNNYARLATLFYVFAMGDKKYNNMLNFGPDPMVRFVEQQEEFQTSAAKAKEYWKGVLETQLTAAKNFAEGKTGIDDLNKRIKEIEGALQAMERSTYFHLGRFGNYGVSFSIRKKDGDLDLVALNKLRDAMEAAKLDGFEFLEAPDKTKAFLRFETVDQRDDMVQIIENLTKQGYIEPNSLRIGTRAEGVNFPGETSSARGLIDQVKSTIESQIARVDTTTDQGAREVKRLRKVLENVESYLNSAALELSPENSIARVLARRKTVSGFGSDAFRSLAYRYQVNADALANMASAPYLNQSILQVSNRVREAGQPEEGGVNLSDLRKMEAIRDEIFLRSDASFRPIERNWLDSLRAYSFAYYLSSPSSALLQQASIPTIVWPELGKKFGFVKSAKALGKAAPQAFKIMNSVVSLDLQRGLTRGVDITLTPQALQKTGLDPATIKFVQKLANTTAIDFGSAARELGRVAEGAEDTLTDKTLRWAGFMNSYSETFSRILTALAVRQLSANDTVALTEAKRVIEETLYDYDATNQARQIGPEGVLGKYSPVALQFNTFSFFTMEKLYREMLKAIGKNATAEEKAQARKFMGGFLAAQTVVAGSLGLPFASVLARVIEAMVETLGDEEEPYDAKSAWKNFLSDAFGADVGEVIASGAFRQAGLDIQSRVGLQDLAPFSRFLTDRRKFEDSFGDLVKDMAGAPIGFITSAGMGVSELYRGNIMEGMKGVLPGAFRGLVNAYEMSDRGYVDKQGNVLPMSADANDILASLLGFRSAEMGRYSEARMAQIVRQGSLSRQAGDLRRKMALAIEKQDMETARDVYADIQKFDRSNPEYAVGPSIARTLTQRMRARAQAEATGTTIGTNIRDIGSIEAQGFANIGQ